MTVSDDVGEGRSTADADPASVEEGRSSAEVGRRTRDGNGHAEDGDRRFASVDRSATDRGSSVTDGRPSTRSDERSSVTTYRWACPICGKTRTGMASGDENPRAKAEFCLRQHVQTSDDDGHGPANAYPPGFDPDAAGRAVSVD